MSSSPNDIIEVSKTSLAKCRICHGKIYKNVQRIGSSYFDNFSQEWHRLFYHWDCIKNDASLIDQLSFSSTIFDHQSIDTKPTTTTTTHAHKHRLDDIENSSMTKRKLIENEFKRQYKFKNEAHSKRKILEEMLRNWRFDVAKRRNMHVYEVFHDSVIDGIVEQMPTTKGELLQVCGIGHNKCELYGTSLLETIAEYKRNHEPGNITPHIKRVKTENK